MALEKSMVRTSFARGKASAIFLQLSNHSYIRAVITTRWRTWFGLAIIETQRVLYKKLSPEYGSKAEQRR